jgi:hypothetical protein
MKNQIPPLSPALRELAEQHFVLLESLNVAKKRDVLQLNLSGYGDVMQLIGDLVKVSILAMGDGEPYSSAHIPQPLVNISGVLGIILDLIPYEEADLLDQLRAAVLEPDLVGVEEEDFLVENIFLTMPVGLMD